MSLIRKSLDKFILCRQAKIVGAVMELLIRAWGRLVSNLESVIAWLLIKKILSEYID